MRLPKSFTFILVALFIAGLAFPSIPQELMQENISILAILLFALPAFIGLIKWLGFHKGIGVILLLGLFSLFIETIGLKTGFPYSDFIYGMPIGYRLFGTTPWTVFFAWSPFVIGAFALAKKTATKPLSLFLMMISLLIAYDLVLEPSAIARGLWLYQFDGFWYSAPLSNFLGWIFSSTLAGIILYVSTREEKIKEVEWLQSSFLFSLAFWTGTSFSYGFILPALIGLVLLLKILL